MENIVHLETRINQIYDHLYANASVRTPAAIAKEVGKILRTIAYLEKTDPSVLVDFHLLNKNRFDSKDSSIIKGIAEKIRRGFRESNKKSKFFDNESQIALADVDIAFTCGKMSGIEVSSTRRDVFGDAMEIFRSHFSKSTGGQFFTDQRVTQLAIKLLRFNPLKDEDLVDVCAGTGGFLIAALSHIKKITGGDEKLVRTIASKTLCGQEIDKELCDIANITIATQLGLAKSDLVNRGDSVLPESFIGKKKISFDSHYCLATNPPFGTKITIKDTNVLESYDLAKTFTRSGLFGNESKITQRAPDILFIEQNIKLLKPGVGRLAIVVPYQIVSGPQTAFVRNWILRHAEILAVIDLPPETFQPHTGTKASLLILRRRKKPLEKVDLSDDGKIFMSVPRWIGHDRRGNPTYKRASVGSQASLDEILTDFPQVEEAFEAFCTGENPSKKHPLSFVVPAEKISQDPLQRIDARYYKIHADELLSQKKPKAGWKTVKLKEVVSDIFYPGRFARNYVTSELDSVPFLGGTNISQLLLRTEKRIGLNNEKIAELKVKAGWILITRSGSVGIVATVPRAWEGFAVSEHVIRIIPDKNKLAPEYLYAFLKTSYAQNMMARGVYGSVIDEITPEYIGNLDIPIPKKKESLQAIVKIISKGEQERQKAIESLSTGVKLAEKLFI
jgi:type I restriction-modification system DNA methylase subunit